MFCKHCGKQIPDDTKFCPYCGKQNTDSQNRQTENSKSEGRIPAVHPKSNPTGSGRRGSKIPLMAGLSVILLVLVIAVAILFASVLKGRKDSSDENTEEITAEAAGTSEASGIPGESAASDETDSTDEAANAIPPNSSEDDGNLFGNTHCYARAVSDGAYLYFRNALDKEKTYWVKNGEHDIHPLTDVYMKDLHYKDEWLYFSRTTEGDVAVGTRDNNIYRMKTDGSNNTNLTNLTFNNPQSWLSFETMSGGNCFFVYTDGKGISVDIGYAPENGGSSTFLTRIPAANVVDNPCVNVIGKDVYFLAKDGLHCVDINTKVDALVIPGFSCEEFIIYDGVIYFVTGERQGTADRHSVLSVINLDGTGRKELFVSPTRSGFSHERMQASIYQGNLYLLVRTSYAETPEMGCLYSLNSDGSDCKKLMEDISWFNIVDHTLYYRFIDSLNMTIEEQQFAPYYSVPFEDVKAGKGNTNKTQLFDVTPFKNGTFSESVSASSQSSSSQLPANIRSAYDAVMKYPQFAVSDLYDDNYMNWRISGSSSSSESNPSQFIDLGDYYEVTNCNVTVPNIISAEVVSQCAPGYTLTVQEQSSPTDSYTCTFIVGDLEVSYDGRSYYELNDPVYSQWAGGLWLLPDGSGYITVEDDALITALIYSGSLYFSKDCQVYGYGSSGGVSAVSIPFSYYITQPQSFENGYEYGYQYNQVSLYGYPVFDSETGLIVKYKEQYTP